MSIAGGIRLAVAAILVIGTAATSPVLGDDQPYRVVWTEADCRSCHTTDRSAMTHPVNVRPTRPVPASLPLSAGRVTCVTCHNDDSASHAASRQQQDGNLRANGQPGTAFCAQCHDPASSKSGDVHALALGVAHPQWTGRSQPQESMSMASLLSRANRPSMAEVTVDCRGCHDGSMSKDLGPSHPVDVDYRRPKAGRGISGLVPESTLDPRVRLFAGKVQCASCHSPYASGPKLLVMANDQGQLCRSCHDMDH